MEYHEEGGGEEYDVIAFHVFCSSWFPLVLAMCLLLTWSLGAWPSWVSVVRVKADRFDGVRWCLSRVGSGEAGWKCLTALHLGDCDIYRSRSVRNSMTRTIVLTVSRRAPSGVVLLWLIC